MIFNTVGGGGERLFSIIAVTYPEGSICTCSNGTKTLKAKDTSGKVLFNVNIGEWTVTATDGNKTKDATVDITTEGQSESVVLNYTLMLYNYGDQCESATGGWKTVGNQPGSIVFNSDHIYWSHAEGSNVDSAVVTNNLIDFSSYTKLRFEVEYSGITYWCRCGYSPNQAYDNFTAYVQLSGTNTEKIIKDVTLQDVGQMYPKVFFGAGVTYMRVYKVWLE